MSPAPPEFDPHAPIFVVLNVGSGSEDATGTRAVIESVLTQAGRKHEINVVDEPARLSGIARAVVDQASARGGIVVAAGGDGTINAVAQAVLGSGCPFGVLPQGTFNYFARTHGIPADSAEAVRLLLVTGGPGVVKAARDCGVTRANASRAVAASASWRKRAPNDSES